ncbi:YhgE/Pip domain-containing protein [Paenibacillus sp. 7541]|uniref:YhgE/Pip domain-containing protein n=1 Tax=Paenibacillus sp. 7541 TaxID=2026236 RepID=UPI001595CB80|nr:YhgE/Pip domain-containing protein [Paenibacillus sp. 7541]
MMKSIQRVLLVFAAVILLLPSFLVTASQNSNSSTSSEEVVQGAGVVSAKDEVVYARLGATGDKQEIYVVNVLDVEQAGTITDYGTYTSLKNLTDMSPLEQTGDAVEVAAPKGKFYYQGNMNDAALPWNISVSYLLDGKEIAPEDLAGAEGHVQIKIETSSNEEVDEVFFQNYLLQVSLSLDTKIFRNIQAPDGVIANAGKNQQVTFTVMPEKHANLLVEADAAGFELDGIDITAIPSSMSIDAPDLDGMTEDMGALTNAIGEVHEGVGELLNGVHELNDGMKELHSGSEEYKNGISTIHHSSSELVNASGSIAQALDTLHASLDGGMDESGLGDLNQLVTGLSQIAGGLRETATGLGTLQENYAKAHGALQSAMAAIPEQAISEADIQQLYGSGADPAVVERLVETYAAAQTAKGTYSAVKAGLDAVDGVLGQVRASLAEMANQLDAMSQGLAASQGEADAAAASFVQLQEGIKLLSTNYKEFHAGLVEYTGGISQLSSSYEEMHSGLGALSEGTAEFENGIGKLHDGTDELYASTKDLPDQMKEEADRMMAEFDKSDFEPVSYVSPKNTMINTVQFVFKTEGIKIPEVEETEAPEEAKAGFWDRFANLFKGWF